MPANLLTNVAWLVPTFALAVTAVSSITRSLVSLGKKMVEERSRTARFKTALKDSTPEQRAEIIHACGSLEAVREPTEHRGTQEAPQPSPKGLSKVVPFLRGGHETEPGKE